MVTVQDLKKYETESQKKKQDQLLDDRRKLLECVETIKGWQKEKRFSRLISLYQCLDKMKFKSDDVKRILSSYEVTDTSNKMGFSCNIEINWLKDSYYVALERANPKIHDILINDNSIIVEIGNTIMARRFGELNYHHLYALNNFIKEFPVFEKKFLDELDAMVKSV